MCKIHYSLTFNDTIGISSECGGIVATSVERTLFLVSLYTVDPR